MLFPVLAMAGVGENDGNLSLQSVLAAVQEGNSSLKAARAKWEGMKLRVPQARAWEDPMVGVDFERMGTTRFDRYTDSEWMVSQQVPMSGKNLTRGRIAGAEARASFEELRRVQLDILSKARIAYYRLANAYAQLEINERNRTLLGQFADISRVKYEAGTQSQSDVLLAQTELIRLNETRANLERDVVEQQSMLNVLMNRRASAPLGRPSPLSYAAFEHVEERLQEFAGVNRPEVVLAGRKIEAARAQLQLARRQWVPDPQFRVEARHYRGSDKVFSEYDTGVFFSLPWVNFSKYSTGVSEARKNVESAQEERVAAGTETQGLVRDQLQKIETSAKNYLLFRDSLLPLARQSIEATRAGYESDKNGFLELITTRRTLQDVESAMTEHLSNYQIAVAELEAIVGGPYHRTTKSTPTAVNYDSSGK